MKLKRKGFYHKSYMLFHAKQNTVKWKGRNLFSYSVIKWGWYAQVVSTKKILVLVRVKLWPPFPLRKLSILTHVHNSNRHN